jgi:hypothetical protein
VQGARAAIAEIMSARRASREDGGRAAAADGSPGKVEGHPHVQGEDPEFHASKVPPGEIPPARSLLAAQRA